MGIANSITLLLIALSSIRCAKNLEIKQHSTATPNQSVASQGILSSELRKSCQGLKTLRSQMRLHSRFSSVSIFSRNHCFQDSRRHTQKGFELLAQKRADAPAAKTVFVFVDIMGSSSYDQVASQAQLYWDLDKAKIPVFWAKTDGRDLGKLTEQLEAIKRNLPEHSNLVVSVSGHGTSLPAEGDKTTHVMAASNVEPMPVAQAIAGILGAHTAAGVAAALGTANQGDVGSVGNFESSSFVTSEEIAATIAKTLPLSSNSLVILDSCGAGGGKGCFAEVKGGDGKPINIVGAVGKDQFADGTFAQTLAQAYAGDKDAMKTLAGLAGDDGVLTMDEFAKLDTGTISMPAREAGEGSLSENPWDAVGDIVEMKWEVDYSRLVGDDGSGPRILVPKNPTVLGGNGNTPVMVFPKGDAAPGPGENGKEPSNDVDTVGEYVHHEALNSVDNNGGLNSSGDEYGPSNQLPHADDGILKDSGSYPDSGWSGDSPAEDGQDQSPVQNYGQTQNEIVQ